MINLRVYGLFRLQGWPSQKTHFLECRRAVTPVEFQVTGNPKLIRCLHENKENDKKFNSVKLKSKNLSNFWFPI